jgi:hypothetical protein
MGDSLDDVAAGGAEEECFVEEEVVGMADAGT